MSYLPISFKTAEKTWNSKHIEGNKANTTGYIFLNILQISDRSGHADTDLKYDHVKNMKYEFQHENCNNWKQLYV